MTDDAPRAHGLPPGASAEPVQGRTEAGASGRRRLPPCSPRRYLFMLGAVVAIGPLSIDLYLPTFPALEAHFGATAAQVQSTMSSYFLGIAGGQLLYGPVSDRVGRRTPLLFGLALYAFASLLCAFMPSIHGFIGMRLLQALGGCAGGVIARAVLRDLCEPQEMAQALSTLVLIMGIAPVLSPVAGAWIFHVAGWQAVFWVQAAVGFVCLYLVATRLPETLGEPVTGGIGHVWRDYGAMLRNRRYMGFALVGGTMQAGMFTYIAVSSFVFIEAYGLSANAYALVFALNASGLIIASQINQRLLRRRRAVALLRRALATFVAATLVLLFLTATGIGGLRAALVPLFAAIGCLGFSFPNATAGAMYSFGDRAGMASALLGTLQFGAAAIASTAVAHLYNGEPWSMAVVMVACAMLAAVFWVALLRPALAEAPA